MNAVAFRSQLEADLQPGALGLTLRETWDVFKRALRETLEDESCEEFSLNLTPPREAGQRRTRVYLGRLIDASAGSSWRTVEVNVYLEFEPALDEWFELEQGYCLLDGADSARARREAFISAVEAAPGLAPLWGRKPEANDIQIFLWV